jgi:hypothetical protein
MGRIFREFHGISCNSQARSTKRPGLQQYKNYENLLQSHDELEKVCIFSGGGSAEADRN